MPTVVLNGQPRALREQATVADAVRVSGAAAGGRGVAVAVEGEVVPRGVWDATRLTEGARVEILRAVQGG